MDKIRNFKMSHKDLIEWIYCGLFLLFVYVMLNHVLMITRVASESMEPTMMTGSYCLMNRLAYICSEPQRGDIIAFKSDEFGEDFSKRIVGLPGDEIIFVYGCIIINGEILEEDYLPYGTETYAYDKFKVPQGCYFLLGDNREISNDSRFWMQPYIPKDKIKGKMIYNTDIVNRIKSMLRM